MKATQLFLLIALFAPMTFAPSSAHANAGKATLTMMERWKLWYNIYIHSGKEKEKSLEEVGAANKSGHGEAEPVRAKTHAGDGGLTIYTPENIFDHVRPEILNAEALSKQEPYVGREADIQNAVDQLYAALNNNALILGEAGTGKTSMFYQIARQLHSQWRAKKPLIMPIIYKIDINDIKAGTAYKNQLAEKARALIRRLEQEAEKQVWDPGSKQMVPQKVVVIFDEVHQLMGSGLNPEEAGELADIFKPFLGGGTFGAKVSVIGATTLKEAPILLNHEPIARRFGSQIVLTAAGRAQALSILESRQKQFVGYYGVKFPREILDMFVTFSMKYIPNLALPDPALKMMHFAGSRFLNRFVESTELIALRGEIGRLNRAKEMELNRGTSAGRHEARELENKIAVLNQKAKQVEQVWKQGHEEIIEASQLIIDISKKLEDLETQLRNLYTKLGGSVATTDANDLAGIERNHKLNEHIEQVKEELREAMDKQNEILRVHEADLPVLTREQAIEAIAFVTHLPADVISRSIADTNRVLKTELPKVAPPGQAEATRSIGQAISAGMKGIRFGKGPRSVVTLIDESKQMHDVVRSVDEVIFGAKNADDVREASSKTRFIDFANLRQDELTNLAKENISRPLRAIAFLNVDKASPEIRDALTRLLETGKLGDMSLSDAVVFFHYNCADQLPANVRVALESKYYAELDSVMREELTKNNVAPDVIENFLATAKRSDAFVKLGKPKMSSLARILMHRLEQFNEMLKLNPQLRNPIKVVLDRPAVAYKLAQIAGDVDHLDEVLQKYIADPINKMLDDESAKGLKGGEVLTFQLREVDSVNADGPIASTRRYRLDIVIER